MTALLRTLAAVAAGALAAGTAAAQDVTLRLAHVAPVQTSYQAAAERFAANLAEVSGGTMEVEIIPGGALGDLGQLWVQTRAGAIDMHLIDVSAMVAMREAAPFLVMWTPFLFRDQDHLHTFLESESFDDLMADATATTGTHFLGIVGDRPPRALSTASTPVRTPDDLAGLQIRTPEHPMIIGAFEAWGAAPTPLPASELFTALQTGLVDGQDNGVIDFLGAGYDAAQDYYMPLDYIHSAIGIWMGAPSWARMNEDQRGWLIEAAEMAGAAGRESHAAEMEAAMAELTARGVEVVEPQIETFLPARDAIVAEMEGGPWPAGLTATIGDM